MLTKELIKGQSAKDFFQFVILDGMPNWKFDPMMKLLKKKGFEFQGVVLTPDLDIAILNGDIEICNRDDISSMLLDMEYRDKEELEEVLDLDILNSEEEEELKQRFYSDMESMDEEYKERMMQ